MDNEMNNFMQMSEDMFEDDFDRDEPDEELPTQSADTDEDEDFPVQSVEDIQMGRKISGRKRPSRRIVRRTDS